MKIYSFVDNSSKTISNISNYSIFFYYELHTYQIILLIWSNFIWRKNINRKPFKADHIWFKSLYYCCVILYLFFQGFGQMVSANFLLVPSGNRPLSTTTLFKNIQPVIYHQKIIRCILRYFDITKATGPDRILEHCCAAEITPILWW